MILRSGISGSLPIPLAEIERHLFIKEGESTHFNLGALRNFLNSKIENPANENVWWSYNRERHTVDTMVYAGGWWDWKSTAEYWGTKPEKFGMLGRPVHHLKNVCWIYLDIIAENCISLGFQYRLYLLHGFE